MICLFCFEINEIIVEGRGLMCFKNWEKDSESLKKSSILMNCMVLKWKFMSFLCLLLVVWIMCWWIKGYFGISGVCWRKVFLSCILIYFWIWLKMIRICIIIFFCMNKLDKRFVLCYLIDKGKILWK